jgi:Zn-dependent protease
MPGGIPVARLFGIEIRVSLAWVVLLALITVIGAEQAALISPDLAGPLQWAIGVGIAVAFLVSVLSHELAHALVARGRGVAVRAIVLGLVGGTAPLSIEAATPTDELMIACSGPLLSLVLGVTLITAGGFAGLAAPELGALAGGVIVVGGLNLILGVLSLVPGMPLDGGRIVRALAWYRSGDPVRAGLAAARFGRITGWFITALGVTLALFGSASLGLLLLALGWVLATGARTLDRRSRLERLLRGVPVQDAMERDAPRVGPHLTVDTFAARFAGEDAVTALAVVDHEEVLGVIGAQRIRRLGRRRFATTRAAEIMAAPPAVPFLAPGADLADAIDLLALPGLDALAVAVGGHLEGLLTRRSLSALVEARTLARVGPGGAA